VDAQGRHQAPHSPTPYPTQKPLKLLERIIKASSNEGDMVLDRSRVVLPPASLPKKFGRQWAGIDLSSKAVELVHLRLTRELENLFDYREAVTVRTDVPQRTDQGVLPHYSTNRHVLYGEQEGRCAGCRTHFGFRNLTVDHVVPKSRGGTDHRDNLQLLCGHCNSVKGDRPMEYLLAQLKARG